MVSQGYQLWTCERPKPIPFYPRSCRTLPLVSIQIIPLQIHSRHYFAFHCLGRWLAVLVCCYRVLSMLLLTHTGSSLFSIFSPEGKQWLHKAVGEEPFNWDVLSPFAFGPPDAAFGDSTGPRLPQQFITLPPKDVARSLLHTYFHGFNSFCPTFEETDFMLGFELEYPISPESSEKWACLNAALALGCLLDQHSHSKAWLFWKNATLSWEAFITHAPSLLSAQALVAMVGIQISSGTLC